MNVICTRSPYFIVINQTSQTSSKVELYIYNKGNSIPTFPTYTMAEPIASITQTETTYNISNFLGEFINQNIPINNYTVSVENNYAWCLCVVKRYATVAGVESLLTTDSYVCVNGYTDVWDGANQNISDGEDFILLSSNSNLPIYTSNFAVSNFNFLVYRNPTFAYNVKYYNASNTLIYTDTFLTAGANEIFNYVIPAQRYNDSVKTEICLDTQILYSFNTSPILECLYTPMTCSFVNRYGGWQQLVFFKAKVDTLTVKGSEYSLMQESWAYDPTKGQRKFFNINGTKTVKCNTGWIDESYNTVIEELLMSDRVLMNFIPVNLKTQSLTYKTYLKDKNINFEIEFEYSNNVLNDVI